MRPTCHLLGSLVAAVGAATLSLAPAAFAAGAPQVPATWPSEITLSGANLRAQVNPNGVTTTYRFEYLTQAAYEANLKAIPTKAPFAGALKAPAGSAAPAGSGEAPLAVVQHIGGLKANTIYRFHLVATNAEGAGEGPLRYFRTDEQAPLFSLPDDRAWELVSPPDKGGGEIAAPGALFGGGLLQAAAQGGAVTYGSEAAFAGPPGNPGASQYLSQRTSGGWSTQNITVPAPSGGYGDSPEGVPYRLLSSDLARALVQDPRRCEAGESCPRSYSLRATASGALAHSAQAPDLAFAGATPDLKHTVLSTCAALTPNATEVPGPEGCDPVAPNLYGWDGATLALLNLLPAQGTGTPGATLAAPSGAISADGSRAFFTHGGNLYLRDGSQTAQVDEGLGGGGSFETASADGAVAFFTKAAHLYRYEVSGGLTTDLTPGGEVLGVLGDAADGSRVYYATSNGLFLRQGATTTPIATAPGAAEPSSYPPATGTARVSADGTKLAFTSKAELGPYDNNGQAEAYLYDATAEKLTCASCNPSGERPLGPASLPGATVNGTTEIYKPRALSQNGSRLFFESFDSLVPQDTNADRDVYQWQAQGSGSCAKASGCLDLISSGRAEGGASFLDASASGSDVYFLTDGSLVPQDPGLVDVYDARVGGGFANPPSPQPCVGDACQPLPPEPEDPNPGTLFTGTAPNPPLMLPKEKRQKGKGKKGKGKGKKGQRKKQPGKKKHQSRHRNDKRDGGRR